MDGPDFLCIGAQKAGTGWLYEQLRDHPDFWMPPLKELHYFDRLGRPRRETEHGRLEASRGSSRDEHDIRFLDQMEKLCASPEIDFDGYARLFAWKGASISGDITPGYSTLPDELVERVVDRFPSLKVLFIARDPVERAWSQLSMWIRHGIIDSFAEDDFQTVTQHLQRPEVMLRSRPSEIVRRWRRAVAQKSFGLYFFDDLKRDASGTRSAMIEWLGGDARKPSGKLSPRHNPKARKEKLPLSEGMRAHLAKFFDEELKTSAAELGGAAITWPRRYGF